MQSARNEVLREFNLAEKRLKPAISEMFNDVYDAKPAHLIKQVGMTSVCVCVSVCVSVYVCMYIYICVCAYVCFIFVNSMQVYFLYIEPTRI